MSSHHADAPHLIQSLFKGLKKMHWGDITTILAIMLTLGGFAYRHINSQFDRIDGRFERINGVLERIERDNRDFHGRLAHLEGKMEKL